MDGDGSGRIGPQALGGLDLGQGSLHIHVGLGVHAAHNARAAHSHIGLLVGHQHGGRDGVVAAAGGVGAVDPHDNGDAHLVELRVAVEGGAAAPAVGVHLLLFVQLHAGALQQINEGNAQPLGRVAAPEQVVRLAGHPGTGVLLVVGGNDAAPFAVHPAQALDDGGGAVLVVLRVIQAVQGAPGALVHQQGHPLHGGELTLGVHVLVGLAAGQSVHNVGVDVVLNGPQLVDVLGVGLDRLAHCGHVLEIPGHGIVTQCKLLLFVLWSPARRAGHPITVCFAGSIRSSSIRRHSGNEQVLHSYSLGILINAWPGSISSRMMRRISWSGSGKISALEQSISKPVFS